MTALPAVGAASGRRRRPGRLGPRLASALGLAGALVGLGFVVVAADRHLVDEQAQRHETVAQRIAVELEREHTALLAELATTSIQAWAARTHPPDGVPPDGPPWIAAWAVAARDGAVRIAADPSAGDASLAALERLAEEWRAGLPRPAPGAETPRPDAAPDPSEPPGLAGQAPTRLRADRPARAKSALFGPRRSRADRPPSVNAAGEPARASDPEPPTTPEPPAQAPVALEPQAVAPAQAAPPRAEPPTDPWPQLQLGNASNELVPAQARAEPASQTSNLAGDVAVQNALNQLPQRRAPRERLFASKRLAPASDPGPEPAGAAPEPLSARAEDAAIGPLRPESGDARRQILAREVRVGGAGAWQAVVIDRAALARQAERTVIEALAGGPLATLQVCWLHGLRAEAPWADARALAAAPAECRHPPPPVAYLAYHRFATPFDDTALWLGLPELPATGTTTRRGLWLMAGLGALALVFAVASALWAGERHLALVEQREDFVSAVTHELRSPLTSIRLYAELLEHGVGHSPERRARYLATIRGQTQRLEALVDGVLALAALDRAQRPPGDSTPIAPLLDELRALLAPQAAAKGLELRWAGPPPAAARCDGATLRTVLTNLIDNAIKFSPERAGPVEITVTREAAALAVTVADCGPGVAPGSLREIFEPFRRGERELTRQTRGTGLGLALVRAAVDAKGGRVWAELGPAGGLVVSARWPEPPTGPEPSTESDPARPPADR